MILIDCNKGITGKSVNVAMIDNTLLLEHIEYGNQVKYYGEVGNVEHSASMHGPCMASLCVGKTCGVAPGVSLYFIGSTNADFTETSFTINYTYYAKALD